MSGISERQAGMMQERVRQLGLSANAREPGTERAAKGAQVLGTDVREFGAFDVAPDLFDGIQVGRVRGQSLDRQPGMLPPQVRGHQPALVGAEAIPNEDDPPAPEVAFQLAQESDEHDIGVAARMGVEVEARPPAVPAKGQRPRHRQTLPVPTRVDQDGRASAGCPRAADDRLLRDAAFVFEDDPGVLARGVFFTVGQRWLTHCRMAASSRSRARRAGRCSDHFSRRRMYQT